MGEVTGISARAYIAVAELYELYITGEKIWYHRLDPVVTRFDKRSLYAVSATHIGFSTLRMEPCWMAMGEAAGVSAILSIRDEVGVQSISVPRMQRMLLNYGARLIHYRDIDPEHENFQALQYFGVRGFIPEWEANIEQPVTREEAEEWLKKSGVPEPVDYMAGTTTRGEFLQQIYDMIHASN